MFAKLSTLALALPLVSALTINPLTGATSAGLVTITWTASTQDPSYFSIELVNQFFHNTFAIANNVQTSLGQLTVQLPELQSDDHYSIEAIDPTNLNNVLSQSGQFSVGPTTTPTTSAASTTSSATDSSTSGSVSTLSAATTALPVSSVAATPSTASSSSATASPSQFASSGAASLELAGVLPAAALVLSVVAGAAMVF